MLRYIIGNDQSVVPITNNVKICSLCIEPNSLKRKCCNVILCDHCYTKNEKCPNCHTATRKEALTGATFQLKVFSEHEECRVCLEPGLSRRCCSNYYCDNCYYKLPTCRSCGSQVGHVGDDNKNKFLDRALLLTVLTGWAITIFVTLSVIVFFTVVTVAESEAPIGLSDFECYGFFRSCEISKCIDLKDSVATGLSPIPPLSSWRECTSESSVKLESKACIYDRVLYFNSDRTLGYDICADNFNEGVYVFEDTFEYWKNVSLTSNFMVSAKWKQIVNAYADKECGVGTVFGGQKALRFSGLNVRKAETENLDVSSGGKLQFEMFMPPLGYDVSHPLCRTGYQGAVYVEYSINQGYNWTLLKKFEPQDYRSEKFFSVSLDIPNAGISIATRFKFQQLDFNAVLDNWALDNVRVLRYLPNNWHSNHGFIINRNIAQDVIQEAQCCLDTDWCEKRYSMKIAANTCKKFEWYKGEDYLLRLSEIFLLVAVVINLLKFFYISIQDWYIKSRYPFQDEVNELLSFSSINRMLKKIPLKYRLRKVIPDEYLTNIHNSARMEQAIRDQFADEEGEGELLQSQEVLNQEKKIAKKKLRKITKKLETRKSKKNFKGSDSLDQVIDLELEEKYKLEETQTHQKPSEGGFVADETKLNFSMDDGNVSELDRFQRQNHSLLRVPFNIEHSSNWRNLFGGYASLVFVVFFFVNIGYTESFLIYKYINPYGQVHGEISISSYFMLFIAALCDFKEIWYTIKYVIPLRDRWIPQVTLDLSDEGRSLIVGHFIVPISEIKEYSPFTENYIGACAFCYALGVFPWCLFSLLLRQTVLDYSSMRIVTPMLGSIIVLRAILGSGFALKISVALFYFYDINFRTRELIGMSFQTTNSINTALNTALGLLLLVLFFVPIFAFDWLGISVGVALFGGALYGLFTGCIHNLPIRPWMYITTLRSGIWIKLKKYQRCPCLYWGKYCTEMHNYEETCVIYLTDEIKFMTLLNGGINAAIGMQKNGGE